MNTVTLGIRTLDEAFADFAHVWKSGEAAREARIDFPSVTMLWKVLTPNRIRIIETMTGAGEMGVRELARRVERDVKGVHADAQALVLAGVIEKTADGKLLFPYDAVHVEFTLKRAG